MRVADDEEENYRFYYIWWLEVNQCDYCPLRGQLRKCKHFPRDTQYVPSQSDGAYYVSMFHVKQYIVGTNVTDTTI